MSEPLLQIKNLCVDFKTSGGVVRAVDDVSFALEKGQTLALVGESGSGKSITALSTLQLLPYPMAEHNEQASIRFAGQELVGAPEKILRAIRGRKIGMIFQEPQSALNPLHNIERQIAEPLRIHQGLSPRAARARVLELLDLVGLEKLRTRLNAYPHELSGGQRQRVMIAMALANEPDLLIADEPTTALDVTVQAQILDLLTALKNKLNMAVLLITHDLSIVERMADQICVMQQGKIVEQGLREAIFQNPQHDYTKRLLNAQLHPTPVRAPLNTSLLSAQNIHTHFPKTKNFFGKPTDWVRAVDGIDLTLAPGRTLGVVGESGSGKSTLGLSLLRLVRSTGAIKFDGQDINALSNKALRPLRRDMQIVFQDPYASLSPRMSVGEIIGEGLRVHEPALSREEHDSRVITALEEVQMAPQMRHRYPHEFSGGQRQRISIARALVLNPRLIVLDEPTSALDVSIQAEIVELLRTLQDKHELAYIFISHDLRVIRAMADDLIVMKDGKIVESGPAADIFDAPRETYTKALLAAALNLDTRAA